MDSNFLQAYADLCRSLADRADQFTKRRLLDLAADYERQLPAAAPSAATRVLKAPLNIDDRAKQI